MDPLTPTETQTRRLALIRQLFLAGVEQSRSKGLAAGFALLHFHDAAEMMLQLVCEQRDVRGKIKEFADYWEALTGKGLELTGRAEFARLNIARVNLKHRGLLPPDFEIEGFRAATTNLLNDVCEGAFGCELASITLSSLVQPGEIHDQIAVAEAALALGDYGTAIGEAAVTFRLLMRQLNTRSRPDDGRRSYSLRNAALGNVSTFDPGTLSGYFRSFDSFKAKSMFEAVISSANVFADAITVVGHGLDLQEYLSFRSVLPAIYEMADGSIKYDWMIAPPTDEALARGCLDFVVNCALRVRRPES